MEKKISAADEKKLANAIDKAATLAVANPDRDRNEVLAECLLKEDVDSRFAKVASAAFNKRATVLTFQQTKDEDRVNSFPLTDSDTVYSLMGGQNYDQNKTAAYTPNTKRAFEIGLSPILPEMKKVAAETKAVSKPLYEERVTWGGMERHLESMMQKHASAFIGLVGKLDNLNGKLAEDKKELTKELSKTASFDFRTLCNLYGEKLKSEFSGNIKDRDFVKTAAAADPGTKLSRKLARYFIEKKASADLNNALVKYQDGLDEFSKTAADLGNAMQKTAMSPSALAYLALKGGTGLAVSGINSLDKVRKATADAATGALSNAGALWQAGTDNDVSPSKVLSADFITRDRLRDRLLGWSDMSADPTYSMYPAEQVFMATQKAMDINPALERPDHREVLRAQVGQLLAQNNRASTADISALAATLKALAEASPAAAKEVVRPIDIMDKVKAPEALSLNLDYLKPDEVSGPDLLRDFGSVLEKELDRDEKGLEDPKKEDTEVAKKKEQDKKDAEKAQRESDKQKNDLMREMARQRIDYMRANNITHEPDGNGGHLYYRYQPIRQYTSGKKKGQVQYARVPITPEALVKEIESFYKLN